MSDKTILTHEGDGDTIELVISERTVKISKAGTPIDKDVAKEILERFGLVKEKKITKKIKEEE